MSAKLYQAFISALYRFIIRNTLIILSYNLMINLKLEELEDTRSRFQMLVKHKQDVNFFKKII